MERENNFFIIDNPFGENLWKFYLRNSILYYENSKDTSENVTKIIDDVKTYDLCMDNNQRIHILCVINSGKLIYLVLKGNKWMKNTLHTFPSDANSIDDVKMLVIDNTIHIFYNFRFTAPNIKFYNYRSFIMHGYKAEYEWIQAYIGTFHNPNNPRFFIEIDSNQSLHYFYLSHNQKDSSINRLVFAKNRMQWFEPKDISLNIPNTDLLQVLIDTNDIIHFIIKDINTSQVYHYSVDNASDNDNKYSVITTDKHAYDFKILEYNKKLCVCWKTQNSFLCINSDDFGKTWSEISKYSSPKLRELKYCRIINETKSNISVSAYGYLENNEVSLLGINDIPIAQNSLVETDPLNNHSLNIEKVTIHIEKEKKDEIKLTPDTFQEEDKTDNITSNNDIDLRDETTNIRPDNLLIQQKEIKEQSLWKKITNYLTLKE